MLSIAFIHGGKSFMPEIDAYRHYFERVGVKSVCLINPSQSAMEPYDILWFFMGMQPALNKANNNKIIVHEYCSASTPPFARLKDFIKKYINPPPSLRITLTAEHRGAVFTADNIPLITRAQGVHSSFFEKLPRPKTYDFIYTGSAMKQRNTDKWLQIFLSKFPSARIILIGNHERAIIDQFKSNQNICFNKPVPVELLPSFLASAQYAVNYVPDVYPFNKQPSTKLLEYCAAGCSVISNEYEWVNKFSQSTNAGIFFLDDHFTNLSAVNLQKFHFDAPDMNEYKWENVFKKMQILQYFTVKAL